MSPAFGSSFISLQGPPTTSGQGTLVVFSAKRSRRP